MFDDMFIPWTPRFGRKQPALALAPAPPAPAPAPSSPQTPPKVCTTTLHIARAIIAETVSSLPEVTRAINAAFIAYIRGELALNLTGDPASWAVIHNVP